MPETKTAPTPDQVRAYLNTRGVCCPMCQSHDISGGQFDVQAAIAWQPVSCSNCNFEWQDTYRLVGIADPQGNDYDPQPSRLHTLATQQQIDAAKRIYQNDETEIDDNATISDCGDGSVWVSAWVYVHGEELIKDLVCKCGNTPGDEGFEPCNAEGTIVEPTPEQWPESLYKCSKCGEILRAK